MEYCKVSVLVICCYVTNDPLKQFKTSDIYYLRVIVGQVSQLGTLSCGLLEGCREGFGHWPSQSSPGEGFASKLMHMAVGRANS